MEKDSLYNEQSFDDLSKDTYQNGLWGQTLQMCTDIATI